MGSLPLAWDGAFCPFIHAADATPRLLPWEMPRRRLAHWLLVLSRDGQEAITVDGVTYPVANGASYLIGPGQLHDLGSARGNRPTWVHFDLVFDAARRTHPAAGAYESVLGPRARFLQPDALAVFGCELPVLAPPPVAQLCLAALPPLIAGWQRGGRVDLLEAQHTLAAILIAWYAHGREGAPPLDSVSRLARAEATALRSIAADFGLPDFAAAAGLSRSRFSALFRRRHGCAPGVWLRRERLRRAMVLLSREDPGIARVGALVGYPDPTVFGRVFRGAQGCSPSAWRARQLGRG